MNAIERYNKAKAQLVEAQAFVALLEAPTNGKARQTVFYCDIKVGENFSKMPNQLRNACEANAQGKADNIMRQSITAMEAELAAIAEEARVEYAQIAADAGVTVP